MPQQYQT